MRDEWAKTSHENTKKFARWQQDQTERTLAKGLSIDRSNRRIADLRRFKESLAVQSSMLRQAHRQEVLKILKPTHKPVGLTPSVLSTRQYSLLRDFSGLQSPK